MLNGEHCAEDGEWEVGEGRGPTAEDGYDVTPHSYHAADCQRTHRHPAALATNRQSAHLICRYVLLTVRPRSPGRLMPRLGAPIWTLSPFALASSPKRPNKIAFQLSASSHRCPPNHQCETLLYFPIFISLALCVALGPTLLILIHDTDTDALAYARLYVTVVCCTNAA